MLLRNSISSTKKFFQKSLQSIKSFVYGGYQRLPKTTPFNPYSFNGGNGGGGGVDMNIHPSNYKELDKFYTDFSDRWNSDKEKAKKRSKKRIISTPSKQENEVDRGSFMKFAKASPMMNNHKKKICVHEGKREEEYSRSKGTREGKGCLVAQKLKELEMMDVSNVDHVLDIEEVLHYYSRLTCPAYLDIVDKFFMDMYSEFASSLSNNSRPRTRSVML